MLPPRVCKVGWIVRPCGSSTRWQFQVNVKASIPPVARAFRSCFRAFVSFQVAQMHFIELASEIFAAAAQDFELIEADNAARARVAADSARREHAHDGEPAARPAGADPQAAAESTSRNPQRKQTPWSGADANGNGKKGWMGCGLRLRCFRR
ncbi:unnamed protein product [Prorocentrum cordatum]|uniref:Uncharacterized protein n=1 Tax=Prorocentrum cordatum TaxID=2364126 RepID=A0ABN9V7L3_9DINO|nr:unnamed protein product [Polarella glacialis]